jgi:hypothetical protein
MKGKQVNARLGSGPIHFIEMVAVIFFGYKEQRRRKCLHFQAFATQLPMKSTRSRRDRQMAAICHVSALNRGHAPLFSHFLASLGHLSCHFNEINRS